MANWQSELDLRDIWTKANEHNITTQELAKELSLRLNKVLAKSFDSDIVWMRDELVEEFEHVASCDEDDDLVQNWFNMAMARLYDWADQVIPSTTSHVPFSQTQKVCWVRTNF